MTNFLNALRLLLFNDIRLTGKMAPHFNLPISWRVEAVIVPRSQVDGTVVEDTITISREAATTAIGSNLSTIFIFRFSLGFSGLFSKLVETRGQCGGPVHRRRRHRGEGLVAETGVGTEKGSQGVGETLDLLQVTLFNPAAGDYLAVGGTRLWQNEGVKAIDKINVYRGRHTETFGGSPGTRTQDAHVTGGRSYLCHHPIEAKMSDDQLLGC